MRESDNNLMRSISVVSVAACSTPKDQHGVVLSRFGLRSRSADLVDHETASATISMNCEPTSRSRVRILVCGDLHGGSGSLASSARGGCGPLGDGDVHVLQF